MRVSLAMRDKVAAWLVLIGGILLPLVGWIAGVALVLTSPTFTRRARLVAVLAPPGGLLAAFVLLPLTAYATTCERGGRVIGVSCTAPRHFPPALAALIIVLLALLAFATFIRLRREIGRAHPQRSARRGLSEDGPAR